MKDKYLDPKYNIDNFKAKIKVVIEFQLILKNFKVFKKNRYYKNLFILSF